MITQHKVAFPGSNEEMVIQIPNVKEEIYVGLDYYGEVAERLQVLCYEVESDEPKVCIRYDATGKIVEVQIWRGIAITFEDGPRTPWEISRDGAEAPEPPEPTVEDDNPDDPMPPRDTKLSWYAKQYTDGKFYWYNDQGYPQGPYSEAEQAWQGLEDYDATYYD